jgi:hypothetical protein
VARSLIAHVYRKVLGIVELLAVAAVDRAHAGDEQSAQMTTAPMTPAPINVVRTPSALLTGAVSANDRGSSPIEINQSRLDTQASSAAGTCRCFAVAQMIVPVGQMPRAGAGAALTCDCRYSTVAVESIGWAK